MGYVLVRSDRRETTAVFEDMSDSFRTGECTIRCRRAKVTVMI